MIPRFHQHRVCEQSLRIAETASLACHAFSALALDFLFRQECSPLTSCSIGQASALCAEQQRVRTFGVVEASLSGVNLRLQYWAQIGGVHGRQVLRTHFARLALNKRKDHFLTQSARSVLETLARMLVVLLPAYVGFVRLNSVTARTKYAAV